MKKVVEMEITIPKGKQRSEELENFKKEMVKAIKETETALTIREENKKKEREDREKQNQQDRFKSQLDRGREDAFKYIEKEMNEKGLKIQDLGQYSNYQEQINNLDKVYKIRSLREEVLSSISKLGRKPRQPDNPPRDPRENPNYPPKPNEDPRFPDKPDKPKYDEPKEREKIQ